MQHFRENLKKIFTLIWKKTLQMQCFTKYVFHVKMKNRNLTTVMSFGLTKNVIK